MARTVTLALALLLAALAAGPVPAAAGGVRIVIGGTPFPHTGHPRHVHRHPGRVIVAPRPVYLAPRTCWAPGAFTHQWVPQSQVYYAWVPGHYNTDALWVEGHYAPQVFPSGYWQPIWIEGRWVVC